MNAEAYRPMILRTIRATANAFDVTLVAEDVEDFAQDTLLALWEKRPRQEVECAWAYARKAAQNVTVDGLRRRDAQKRGHRQTESLDAMREPAGKTASFEEGLLIRDELRQVVKKWRGQLSRRAFKVLYLRTVVGLSSDEAARTLGMTVGAVDSHLHRARRVIFPACTSTDVETATQSQEFQGDIKVSDSEVPTERKEPKFDLGRVVATVGALAAMVKAKQSPREFIRRHVFGDWGELGIGDKRANEAALELGLRIFSAYRTSDGERIWVITEADRSSTCLLLPKEY